MMNNWSSPITKHLWNHSMRVLHIFSKHNTLPLWPIKPSSPSTKELHCSPSNVLFVKIWMWLVVLIHLIPISCYSFFLNGPIPASFCLFSLFSWYNFNNTNWWCAWDSNPGPQDGRRRQNHGAMAATTVQCYQMASLFVKYLAINRKEHLPKSVQFFAIY